MVDRKVKIKFKLIYQDHVEKLIMYVSERKKWSLKRRKAEYVITEQGKYQDREEFLDKVLMFIQSGAIMQSIAEKYDRFINSGKLTPQCGLKREYINLLLEDVSQVKQHDFHG